LSATRQRARVTGVIVGETRIPNGQAIVTNSTSDPSTAAQPTDVDNCWEGILGLAFEDQATHDQLYKKSIEIINLYMLCMTDLDISSFACDLEDGQKFVAEQLAINPDDSDWQRIAAVLAGARVGLDGDAGSA